jgi:hypothetical protein
MASSFGACLTAGREKEIAMRPLFKPEAELVSTLFRKNRPWLSAHFERNVYRFANDKNEG